MHTPVSTGSGYTRSQQWDIFLVSQTNSSPGFVTRSKCGYNPGVLMLLLLCIPTAFQHGFDSIRRKLGR